MFRSFGESIGRSAAEAALQTFLNALVDRGLVIADRTEVNLDKLPYCVLRTRHMAAQKDYKCAWNK